MPLHCVRFHGARSASVPCSLLQSKLLSARLPSLRENSEYAALATHVNWPLGGQPDAKISAALDRVLTCWPSPELVRSLQAEWEALCSVGWSRDAAAQLLLAGPSRLDSANRGCQNPSNYQPMPQATAALEKFIADHLQ